MVVRYDVQQVLKHCNKLIREKHFVPKPCLRVQCFKTYGGMKACKYTITDNCAVSKRSIIVPNPCLRVESHQAVCVLPI